MALLMREVINSGAPPRMARPPMTPEDVAASYAEEETELDSHEAGSAGDAGAAQ